MKLALAVISKWIGIAFFLFGIGLTLPLGSHNDWQISEGIPEALERMKELKEDFKIQYIVDNIETDRELIFESYKKNFEPAGLILTVFGLLLALNASYLQKEIKPQAPHNHSTK